LKIIRKQRIHFADLDNHSEEAQLISSEALTNLGAEELLRLIAALPDGYRLVFNLHVIEGYDHGEIATLLNIDTATSRSQLLKARRRLQTQIEKLSKIPGKYA
jgi:RNA polymerase sigma-70 factor (ECF subfamily)